MQRHDFMKRLSGSSDRRFIALLSTGSIFPAERVSVIFLFIE
jgi:hypothetical protein